MTRRPHWLRSLFISVLLLALPLQMACGDESSKTVASSDERVATLEKRIKELEAEVTTLRAQIAGEVKTAEPVNGVRDQIKPAEPVSNADPKGAAPISDVKAQINTAEPISGVKEQIKTAEPVSTADPTGASPINDAQARVKPAEPPSAAGADPKPLEPVNGIKIASNAALKGVMGRMLVSFPKGAKVERTPISVAKSGETKSAASDYGKLSVELLPGKYDVVISGAKVAGIEVRSKHDTTVQAGVLRVSADEKTHVGIADSNKKTVTSIYGSQEIGLPAGKFNVTVAGQSMAVEIKPGEATDF